MTVIIGAIYDGGVVMVSDRSNILEDEKYSQVSPKIRCRKNICMGFAGLGGYEDEFMDSARDAGSHLEIFEKIKTKYSEIRWKLAVENILKPIGCKKLDDLNVIKDTEIKRYYLEELRSFDPDLKVLVGIYDGAPHICAVGNPGTGGCFDDVGFYAVGAGERQATMMFNFLGYRKNFERETAIFQAYLAKKAAEISLGVDDKTDIFVIDKRGWSRVDDKPYEEKYVKLLNEWVR